MNHQSFQSAPRPIDIEAKLTDQWAEENQHLVDEHGMPRCYYCKKPLNKEDDVIDPFWPQEDWWSYHKKCMLNQGESDE